MSAPQNFQHKFRINGPAAKVTKPPTRTAVSCLPCRTRKLKCNRGSPCESCVARACEDTCSYSAKPIHNTKDKVKTQERIDKLEALVLDLARRTPDSFNSPSSSENEGGRNLLTSAEGSYGDAGTSSQYVGATNFGAILNSIDELRADIEDPNDPTVSAPLKERASIFKCPHKDDLASILEALPPRTVVDRLIPVYFNFKFAKLPAFHGPSWLREYEKFWNDPFSVPVLWIAQFFSILCLATNLVMLAESTTNTFDAAQAEGNYYLAACARCMHLAGYSQPGPNVIETLLIYSQCKFYTERNPAGEVWILMSMIVSLCLRAGYHRDPSHFPGLTVFEAEMRRRTWQTIRQFDLLSAWQLGLRPNIQGAWTDTQKPRNLRDEDFDVDTISLPPARPDDDVGQILFESAKDELYRSIERILGEQLRSRHMSEELVWQLDADLREAFAKIPHSIRLPADGKVSPLDSPELVFMRLKTSILFHKGLCALHRTNMNTRNKSQNKSMEACVNSANNILHSMVYIFEESVQGGRLFRDRWMRTSVHSNDFFYAASVLCWVMSVKGQITESSHKCPALGEQRVETFRNLRRAQQVCDDQAKHSPEAKQVSKALRFILKKAGVGQEEPVSEQRELVPEFVNVTPTSMAPSTNKASGLDRAPQNGASQNGVAMNGTAMELDPSLMNGPLEWLFQNTNGVDWNALDQYLLNYEHPTGTEPVPFNPNELDPFSFESLGLQNPNYP